MILGNSNITIDDLKITSNARFFRKKKIFQRMRYVLCLVKYLMKKMQKIKKLLR